MVQAISVVVLIGVDAVTVGLGLAVVVAIHIYRDDSLLLIFFIKQPMLHLLPPMPILIHLITISKLHFDHGFIPGRSWKSLDRRHHNSVTPVYQNVPGPKT